MPESPAEIWLKLECLQPISSFKIRRRSDSSSSTDCCSSLFDSTTSIGSK
jgi:hypothetical protein